MSDSLVPSVPVFYSTAARRSFTEDDARYGADLSACVACGGGRWAVASPHRLPFLPSNIPSKFYPPPALLPQIQDGVFLPTTYRLKLQQL